MYNDGAVTVICIAFNHEKWIEKALVSVLFQEYENRRLIVVDNGSSDQSAKIIRNWVENNAEKLPVSIIYKSKPEPYCQLFNDVLAQVETEYVVDLSGDDFLYPHHLFLSVKKLQEEPDAAFLFSDATILEESGDSSSFYQPRQYKEIEEIILNGELYETLIRRSYICAPSVVFRTAILKENEGYDATLSYEDFDIQLRLARNSPVVFSGHVGVLKRKHSDSLSAGQYQIHKSKMLPSTLKVCWKIASMNTSKRENLALKERILYELKHAVWSANFEAAKGFVELGKKLKMSGFEFFFYKCWLLLKVDMSWLYARFT